MSRLVVDQIQDVDKTNLVEVDTLGQYINSPETIPVTSSGSGITKTLGEWVNKGPKVNVKDYGAVGTGSGSDDLPAFRAALAALPDSGGTLLVPNGVYWTPPVTSSDPNDWLVIEKDNIEIVAENRHGATLQNFNIISKGSYGDSYPLGEIPVEGSHTLKTASANNFEQNSLLQVIASVNMYSTDAGEWQNGSRNPTKNTVPNALLLEWHTVGEVVSSTEVTLYDEIIFDIHSLDTTGQGLTIPGVSGSFVREVKPVRNFSIRGVVLDNEEGSSFRGVNFRLTHGGGLYDCVTLTNDDDPGRHFRCEESIGIVVEGHREMRFPGVTTGSSWNSFIIGAGCYNTAIRNSYFYGGSQIIDATPLQDAALHLGDPVGPYPEGIYLSVIGVSIEGNTFTGTGDGFTSHPGTFFVSAANNKVLSGSTGFRLRSRNNIVVGNEFNTRREGVALSAFYYNTRITGNTFRQIPDEGGGQWVGTSVAPLSSEVMNGNDANQVSISGNSFLGDDSSGTLRRAVLLRNYGNGVPASGDFLEYTDAIKAALSDYHISGNTFENSLVYIGKFINGVKVRGNTFKGDPGEANWILGSTDSVRHFAEGNLFLNSTSGDEVSFSEATTISYPYATENYIGENFGLGVGVGSSGSSLLFGTGSSNVLSDGISVVAGGAVRSVRVSGSSELNLVGESSDGGRSQVNINRPSNGGTPGNSRLYNYGLFVNDGSIWPLVDDAYIIGTPSLRFDQIYASNGTINTSDEREKTELVDISEAEARVAAKIRGMIKKYKWLSSVEEKGEKARWHFGVGAQSVKEAFDSEGLDGFEYGCLCYDEWDEESAEYDEEGNEVSPAKESGNRYGVRASELLFFMMASL